MTTTNNINHQYWIQPHCQVAFARKLSQVFEMLSSVFEFDADQIEAQCLTSEILNEMRCGNIGLIDTPTNMLGMLLLKENNALLEHPTETKTQLVSINPRILDGTSISWCGYVIGLFIAMTDSNFKEAFETCSLPTLEKSFHQYHLTTERLALVELFNMQLEDVI